MSQCKKCKGHTVNFTLSITLSIKAFNGSEDASVLRAIQHDEQNLNKMICNQLLTDNSVMIFLSVLYPQ